jgi:hypothetical protein
MPSVSSEIIAEITAHMGRFGGDFTAWCVGTARDWHSPVLEAHERVATVRVFSDRGLLSAVANPRSIPTAN